MKGTALVVLGLLLAGSGIGWASNTDGVGAAAFLRRGGDARALAMGGAHVAVADNYASPYWNPAGLARSQHKAEVGGMYTDLFGVGLHHHFLAGSVRFDPTLGERAYSIGLGGHYTEMATEVRGYDEDGNPIGTIRYSERLFGGALGVFAPNIGCLGVSLKAYHFHAPRAGVGGDDAWAFGVGLDAGFAAPVWDGLWLGIAAKDLGNTPVSWRNTPTEPTDRVSGSYTAGAAYTWEDLIMAADFVFIPQLDRREVRLGAEYSIAFASLRAGVQKPLDGPLSFSGGVGVEAMGLLINAAWVQDRELEAEGISDTLVVSASFSF